MSMAVYLALWVIVHGPNETDRRGQIQLVISPSLCIMFLFLIGQFPTASGRT